MGRTGIAKLAAGIVLALGIAAAGYYQLTRGTAVAGEVTVWKTPSCGCCGAWVDHMRANGFRVTVHEAEDLRPIKQSRGVPDQLQSCHTAEVAGYTIEGHVPAVEVKRLLAEKPKARGLAVPGMPIGSPGMEQGDRKDPYDVVLFKRDGTRSVYAKR